MARSRGCGMAGLWMGSRGGAAGARDFAGTTDPVCVSLTNELSRPRHTGHIIHSRPRWRGSALERLVRCAMPMFIKMGLGGTGYLGHPESSLRAARKRSARRKVAEGFPRLGPFTDSAELLAYFSGDKIVCLLCGRAMRTLAVHIERIHGMAAEVYKDRFGIPRQFTLSCQETTDLHSELSKLAVELGIINPSANQSALAREAIKNRTGPRQKSKKMLAKMLDDNKGKKTPAKRGSAEFHRKMKGRPQCQPDVVGDRFSRYWKGRKQSPEHVRKRLKRAEST